MAENQNPISFRADEDTKAKFAEICEQFASKGAALQALIASYEADSAKAALPGCAALIDDFRAHLDAISRSYISQLDLTANTEKRVELEFQARLESKEKALIDSQRQAQQAQETAAQAQAALDAVKEQAEQEQQQAITQVADANDRADRAEQARQVAEQAASDARRTADALAAQLDSVNAEHGKLLSKAEQVDKLAEELKQAQSKIVEMETAAKVAAAQAETAQAKAVAETETKWRDKLDSVKETLSETKDELSKTKDALHQTQTNLATITAERDSLKSQLDMIDRSK